LILYLHICFTYAKIKVSAKQLITTNQPTKDNTMKSKRTKYEITWIDSGVTKIWTLAKCEEHFGVEEFQECLQGYWPHVVAVEL